VRYPADAMRARVAEEPYKTGCSPWRVSDLEDLSHFLARDS
jgi:hypothetical protein